MQDPIAIDTEYECDRMQRTEYEGDREQRTTTSASAYVLEPEAEEGSVGGRVYRGEACGMVSDTVVVETDADGMVRVQSVFGTRLRHVSSTPSAPASSDGADDDPNPGKPQSVVVAVMDAANWARDRFRATVDSIILDRLHRRMAFARNELAPGACMTILRKGAASKTDFAQLQDCAVRTLLRARRKRTCARTQNCEGAR